MCTGSYDEHARLWDTRNISRPMSTAQVRSCHDQLATRYAQMQSLVLKLEASPQTRCACEQVGTGGGTWRVKWHPTQPHLLAAACMHAGFVVLRADPTLGSLQVHEHYAHQRSLGYGVDWSRAHLPAGGLVASCSFYDRLLHLWTPACLARPEWS